VNKFSQTVLLPPGRPMGAPIPPPARYPPANAAPRTTARPATHPLAGPMYWACTDLMTLACQLALGAVPPSAPELRKHLGDLFAGMQARGGAAGIPPEDLADASYAIMALFDEILVQANWPGRLEWQASPLQYVHFHENTAGDGFFRRTELLMGQPHRMHVLQVYFLCLSLGFQGRYAIGGGAGLTPVYESIGNAVGYFLPQTEILSPHGEPADGSRNLLKQEAPIIRIALGFFGIALVAFVILRIVLSSQVSSAVQPMRDYATSTPKR
jgi:type VI secretion system protein ImpK